MAKHKPLAIASKQAITGYETVKLPTGQEVSELAMEAWGLNSWGPTTAKQITVHQVLALAKQTVLYRLNNPGGAVVPGEYAAKNDLADWIMWQTPDQLGHLVHGLDPLKYQAMLQLVYCVCSQQAADELRMWAPVPAATKLRAMEGRLQALEEEAAAWQEQAMDARIDAQEAHQVTGVVEGRLAQAEARVRALEADVACVHRNLVLAEDNAGIMAITLRTMAGMVQRGDMVGLQATVQVVQGFMAAEG